MKKGMGLRVALMAAMFGMGATSGEKFVKPEQFKGSKFDEGVQLNYAPIHNPIHMLNNSQKAKAKRLTASNKKQGRN